MTEAEDAPVRDRDLTAEDRAALGWAVASQHPLGGVIARRVRRGGPGVRSSELADIQEAWERAGRPLPARHVHRTSVTFVDGTTVMGVTFLEDDPYRRDRMPSFGLYLDERWKPPWPHAHIAWPDFGVPTDVEAVRLALSDLLRRARPDAGVEIGCLGGHGRTGTALACLAVLTGTPAQDAVAWVRDNYCDAAIETDEQARFVAAFVP